MVVMYYLAKFLTLICIHAVIRQIHMSQDAIVACLTHLCAKDTISSDSELVKGPIKNLYSLIVFECFSDSYTSSALYFVPCDLYDFQVIVSLKYISKCNCTTIAYLIM